MMKNILLKVKLAIPPLKQDIIERPHLLQKLNNGLSQRFILISVPAGYGIRVFLDEPEMTMILKLAYERKLSDYALRLFKLGEKNHQHGVSAVPLYKEDATGSLTKRKTEILKLLKTPLSYQEIADRLFISMSTVHSHIKSIYSKLNVHKQLEAVYPGKKLGLID
ncbi:MAG: HTH domain-containing protein [Spirochaetales bacterium]|nr:HTH domain-containing protein [Spirochaetales bacterium]